MAIAGGITLGLACIFLFYVLVQFHLETMKPARHHRRTAKHVIVFRKRIAEPDSHEADEAQEHARHAKQASEIRVPQSDGEINSVAVFPIGMRRLAAGRIARS
jgi:hypothetical protein